MSYLPNRFRKLPLAPLLAALVVGPFSGTSYAQGAVGSLSAAKEATRCSVVYGMAAGADKRAAAKTQLLGIQKALLKLAAQYGATKEIMRGWLEEFDSEFKIAVGSESGSGSKVADESFMPRLISQCQSFAEAHDRELESQ